MESTSSLQTPSLPQRSRHGRPRPETTDDESKPPIEALNQSAALKKLLARLETLHSLRLQVASVNVGD
ncbi:hypothetical protein ACHAWO_012327 [Cyclotella atomus]|uniref:Uncharacterized protein n=1 Tax=Cyclotella atomus TaxID=382360 RepID=A0ABD3N6A1_9STRA